MLKLPRQSLKRLATLALASAVLVGCKADEVNLQIDLTQLRSAAAGNDTVVEFEATFTHPRPLNTEQSAQVDDVWSTVGRYLSISDFTRENVDGGLRVTVTAELPVVTSRSAEHAYFLSFTESTSLGGFHRVALETGEDFAALQSALASVNFALDLAEFHPTTLAVTGRSPRLIAPAAIVDDTAHLLYDAELRDTVNIQQSGGAFEDTGAGFFVRMDG